MDYLDHLQAESARFADVLRDADPTARVPSCPDWDAADLLWHLAEVHWFWATIVRDRVEDPEPLVEPDRPGTYAELLDRFGTYNEGLIDVLAATPDDVEVWTWSADHTVGFVRRRMAQETLIHRVDAELTVGAPTALDPALSVDGVHEAFQHFHDGNADWVTRTVDGPIGRLRATDTGDAVTVQLARVSGTHPGNGSVLTDHPCVELLEAGDPSFTVEGTAGDLVRWVWNRPTENPVTVHGDVDPLAAVLEPGVD